MFGLRRKFFKFICEFLNLDWAGPEIAAKLQGLPFQPVGFLHLQEVKTI